MELPEENRLETSAAPVIYPGILSHPYKSGDQAHDMAQFEGSILESWQQIQTSITELAPTIARKLRRGATDTCLLRAEMVLNLDFPEDMKILYSACDGMQPRIGGLVDLWYWYPLELLARRWEEMQEEYVHSPLQSLSEPYLACADPRIQAVRWHPRWIPLMEYDDKGMYCLDLAPTEQEQEGQIILCFGFHYEHFHLVERGVPPVMVVAPNLRTFWAMLAQNLKMGEYAFDSETGVLWSQEGRAFVEKDPYILEAVRGGHILWG